MTATRKKKASAAEAASSEPAQPEETVTSIKGFDQSFACRDFKFEVGQTYEHTGPVKACESGFHAISGHPLEVLSYYPPTTSRYAIVTQSGTLARHCEDSKIASARITIEAEIQLPQLIERAVKWVFDRAKWSEGSIATGNNEGATASGDSGAATASGVSGAATASGYRGAATASGVSGQARGAEGCALFLVYRDPDSGKILHAWAGIVGCDGIEPMVWYALNSDGKPQAAT